LLVEPDLMLLGSTRVHDLQSLVMQRADLLDTSVELSLQVLNARDLNRHVTVSELNMGSSEA
jgi:hypothetical protein